MWQLKLLSAFYDRAASSDSLPCDSRLLTQEFLVSLQSRVETVLNQWVKSTTSSLSHFYSYMPCIYVLVVVNIRAVIAVNVYGIIDVGDFD